MADQSKKKRKRNEDLSVRPKPESQGKTKKNKIINEEVTAPDTAGRPHALKVSSLLGSPLTPPVIATTPGLILPDNTKFQSYSKQDNARKNGLSASRNELLLHSDSHRTMDYTAREDHPKGLLKHYIGVFDPQTGSLQVVEARKMTLRGTVRARKAADEALLPLTEQKTMRDLRNELGQTFGTKKAKKAILALTENAIGRTSGSQNELDEGELALMASIKDSTANVATREELQAIADLSRPVPKGHYDAEVIQDVYRPEEIVGADVLNAIPIRDWQEKAETGEEVLLGSSFVAHRLNKVATGPSAVERLRLLRYLYFLLTFLKCAEGKGSRPKKIPKREDLKKHLSPAPEIVVENIRRKFSERGEILKAHVDLILTHLCAFACIIDNFEVDTTDLRNDLALEAKVISQYFNEIGARTRPLKRGGKPVQVATLALPLQFPKLRIVRQGRR
ncbi:RNA polymerase I associated factor, A49-like protein [Thozetella sp. PMI_491]|nr:RNA polymerase I associated factor, A49-like protein [Thozetella sp. PMI_491]